jgi:hypothetical protein
MAVTGTPIAGTDGRVTTGVSNFVINADEFRVTPVVDVIKTTNFESNSKHEVIPGNDKADVTIKGFWDLSKNPGASPPNFKVGQFVLNTKLYTTKTGTKFFDFPRLLVVSTPVVNTAEGRVDIEVSFTTDGTYSYPT